MLLEMWTKEYLKRENKRVKFVLVKLYVCMYTDLIDIMFIYEKTDKNAQKQQSWGPDPKDFSFLQKVIRFKNRFYSSLYF